MDVLAPAPALDGVADGIRELDAATRDVSGEATAVLSSGPGQDRPLTSTVFGYRTSLDRVASRAARIAGLVDPAARNGDGAAARLLDDQLALALARDVSALQRVLGIYTAIRC